MFINHKEIGIVADESTKAIRKLFFQIDQANPGLFQEKTIKIPKIHKQSKIMELAGENDTNTSNLITRVEFEELDHDSPAHAFFERHLKLTRNDESFIPTGWQTHAGRMTIHNRIRFMIAQCWVDGVILPKIMAKIFQKRFPQRMPSPIFVISTTRKAGAVLQEEAFNLGSKHPGVLKIQSEPKGVIAPFQNMGNWTLPAI